MGWIKQVPGWPILGNALEFGETTGGEIFCLSVFLLLKNFSLLHFFKIC